MMISLSDDSDLIDLLKMSEEDLIKLAFEGSDSLTEVKVASIFDMFHKMFHDYNWGSRNHGCSEFNRMLAVAYILGKNSRDAREQPVIFGKSLRLFTQESLDYVLSEQSDDPEEVFDSLPREERDAYIRICRHAFEDRMELAYQDRQPLTPEILFNAAVDGLIIMRQLQMHVLSSRGLENFINFSEET